MGVTTTQTNKPLNPRGNDQSPLAYNRAKLFSGKALDFDGVNDEVTTGQDLGNLQTLSVAMHCRIDSFTDGSGRSPISQWHGSDGWMIYKSGSNSELIFYRNANFFAWSDSAKYSDQWIHLVYVIEQGVGAYVYANGELVASDTTFKSDLDYTNNPTLKIGAFGNTSAGFLNGAINGVKLFNTALTAAQVADLYNNPEKVVPTGVDNTALKLWLPMMEGAGTTAYDGSGNGNHGAISGATYTHGIGAPVAQTAVIDWNKLYVFDKTDDYASIASYNDVTGTKTYKVSFEVFDTSTDEQQIFQFFNVSAGKGVVATYNTFGTYKRLGFRGYASGADFGASSWNDVEHNTPYELVFTINWDTETLESISLSGDAPVGTSTARMNPVFTGLVVGYRWNAYPFGGFINYFEVVGEEKWTNASGFKSESGSYDMTITGSPTQILAPQGLTTGRDITGVNLFENVRKQGALNLDGNSWAEVHDNASIDLSDANASFEAWVYHIDKGVVSQYIMNKFDGTTGVRIRTETGNNFGFYASDGTNNIADSGDFALTANAWNHIVLTTDGTNFKRYINGALVDTDVAGTPLTTFANADSLYIGSEQTNASLTESRIAQPRIYNRALTAEEVQRNYNAGKNIYS